MPETNRTEGAKATIALMASVGSDATFKGRLWIYRGKYQYLVGSQWILRCKVILSVKASMAVPKSVVMLPLIWGDWEWSSLRVVTNYCLSDPFRQRVEGN